MGALVERMREYVEMYPVWQRGRSWRTPYLLCSGGMFS